LIKTPTKLNKLFLIIKKWYIFTRTKSGIDTYNSYRYRGIIVLQLALSIKHNSCRYRGIIVLQLALNIKHIAYQAIDKQQSNQKKHRIVAIIKWKIIQKHNQTCLLKFLLFLFLRFIFLSWYFSLKLKLNLNLYLSSSCLYLSNCCHNFAWLLLASFLLLNFFSENKPLPPLYKCVFSFYKIFLTIPFSLAHTSHTYNFIAT